MDVKKKHELEAALATEAQAISSGQLKEENPLDLSDDFRLFCEACRRGDEKVCQEMISKGVNINARDKYDYTPLILVSLVIEIAVALALLRIALTAVQGQPVRPLRGDSTAPRERRPVRARHVPGRAMLIQRPQRPNTKSAAFLRLPKINQSSATAGSPYHLTPHTSLAQDCRHRNHRFRSDLQPAQVLARRKIAILFEEARCSASHCVMEAAG